jgi:circadian clock protein KaiC
VSEERATPQGEEGVRFTPLEGILSEPIPFGTAWQVTGDSGAGKSTFGYQFIVEGLRARESAVFVACDESPDRIRRALKKFGFGTDPYEREGKLLVLDAFSQQRSGGYFVSDKADQQELLYVIKSAVDKAGRPCRVVIDSLASVMVNYSPRDFVNLIYDKNRLLREDNVVLLDLYLSSAMGPVETYGLTNAYDVIAELFVAEERGGVPKRNLRVSKVRGQPFDPRAFPFALKPQQGLVVNADYYRE